MNYRQLFTIVDTIKSNSDLGEGPCVVRVASCVVLTNPLAGRQTSDLSVLTELGQNAGRLLTEQAVALLPDQTDAYGKAAVVGIGGTINHGAAIIHPKMGKPLREHIGGGDALIPSNVKVGGPGTIIDVPVCHRNNPWSFNYLDTMTIHLPEAPLPDEVCIIVVLSCGSRIAE